MYKLSTKQKREVYAISNLLLHVLVFVILLLSLNSCTGKDLPATACTTLATLKDRQGLDGCDYILVLDNEQKLEPVGWDGTSPLPDDASQPLQNFSFKDDQRVSTRYNKVEAASICMVGQTVAITCFSIITNSHGCF